MIKTNPRGTWIDETLIDHTLLQNIGVNSHAQIDSHIADGTIHFLENSIDHLNIQNIGINSHVDIDNFISAVPSTYLKLDASNDPITGILTLQSDLEVQGDIYTDNIKELTGAANITIHNHIFPGTPSGIDFGDISNPFRSIFLDNNNGKVIDCSSAIGTTIRTNYTFDLGGGGNVATEGGDFLFQMDPCVGACQNNIVFDVGNVYWAGAGFFNRFRIQSFTGLRTYAFVAAFGGFNNVNYGWELQYVSGIGNTAKTLFLDNQTASGAARSIDFRIGTVDKLTIENNGTVNVVDRITTPELTATVINNGFNIGSVAVPGVSVTAFGNFFGLNWFDYLTINAVTTNLPVALAMFPNGTATASYANVYNSSNTGATAWLSMGVRGSISELVVRDFAQTTNITDLNIGSGGNDFPVFDVTCNTLTSINFIFAGLTECQIQLDTLIFNNGAIDTQIDWGTNGQLGFQVAAADIIRISAALVSITQDVDINGNIDVAGNVTLTRDSDKIYLGALQDVDLYYDGIYCYLRTDLQNPSDFRINCGTNKTIELQTVVWDDLRIVPGAFDFAGVSDPSLQNWQPGGAGSTFKVYKFKSGDEVFFTCQVPHTYKEGTDIEVHVHWTPADRGNEENGNTVAWKLDYSWANINAVFSSSSTANMTDTCTGTDDYHEITTSATITGTSKTISSMLVCRLYRDAGDTWAGVTAAQSPALLEFDIHFQINTIGSRQESTK
jgi:hypothetical protein